MADEEPSVNTFPNRTKVDNYIVILTNPLKEFMISTLKRCKVLLTKPDPSYGLPPKINEIDAALYEISKAKEIHGLADFFIQDDGRPSNNGRVFKYAYCRTKRIKPHHRGQLPTEGDRFQRWIKELHDGRNLVVHLKDEGGNLMELDDDLTRFFGSLMILLAKDIEGPNNKNTHLSQTIAEVFNINGDDRSLKEAIEGYEITISELRKNLEYERDVNRTMMENNRRLCTKVDEDENIIDRLSEQIRKLENEKRLNLKLENLRDKAECGDSEAQYFLAVHYSRPDTRNADKALKWMTDSANGGYTSAQLTILIEKLFEAKNGNKHAYAEINHWCTKLAEKDIPQVDIILGDMYAIGEPFAEQSNEKAFEWYMKAAEQNELVAIMAISDMYYGGRGVEQSYVKAFEWAKKGAEQNDANALCFVGESYYHGTGVEQSYEQSYKWFMRAAELDYPAAQYYLGLLYYYGDGVKQSHESAFKWFKDSAEHGYTEAELMIGGLYFEGKGAEQSIILANKWFMRAAEKNNPKAKELLELNTLTSEDNSPHYSTIGQYLEAAKNGDVNAQEFIGSLYESGPCMEDFRDDAIRWYKKAKEGGGSHASERLKVLNKN